MCFKVPSGCHKSNFCYILVMSGRLLRMDALTKQFVVFPWQIYVSYFNNVPPRGISCDKFWIIPCQFVQTGGRIVTDYVQAFLLIFYGVHTASIYLPISVIINDYNTCHFLSTKYIWKYCLQIGAHFVHAFLQGVLDDRCYGVGLGWCVVVGLVVRNRQKGKLAFIYHRVY